MAGVTGGRALVGCKLEGMALGVARFCAITAISAAAACSSGGGGGQAICGADTPVQCHDAGTVVGCCPATHPVCSPEGCLPSTASGGSAGGGAGGDAGSTAGTSSGATGGAFGGSGGAFGGSGGTSGSSATGGTGGTPSGGTGGATPCTDPGFEPNDSEPAATNLGAITDCDSTGSAVSGNVDGSADTDFYVFAGSDGSTCLVDATASTTAKVRLCMFAECSGVAVSCDQGSAAVSPAGRAGCCVDAGGTVQLGINCSGFSDDATVYVRVDQPTSGSCTSYSVDYHY